MPNPVIFHSLQEFIDSWRAGLFGDFGFRNPQAFSSVLMTAGHTASGDHTGVCLQGGKTKPELAFLESDLGGVAAEYAARPLAEFPGKSLQVSLIDAAKAAENGVDIAKQKTDNIKTTNPADYSNDMDGDTHRDTYLGRVYDQGKTYYIILENE